MFDDDDYEEEEAPAEIGSSSVDINDSSESNGQLADMLLGLIGATSQTLAVMSEVDDQEYESVAKKIQFFFSLVSQFPTVAGHKRPPNKVVGFQAPEVKSRPTSKRRRHKNR